MLLTFEQLEIIQQYVSENGLLILEVQEDVVDHLCCLIEEKMEEGFDFENGNRREIQTDPEPDGGEKHHPSPSSMLLGALPCSQCDQRLRRPTE